MCRLERVLGDGPDLGQTQASAGRYDAAVESLDLYLLAAPNAEDAAAVRRQTYELEAKKEKSAAKK